MIKHSSVVGMAYKLTNKDGTVIDQASAKEPFLYLHGFENIVVGLERALDGLKPGDQKKVTVSPEDGYGLENPNLYVKVPRSSFPKSAKLDVGTAFQLQSESGEPAIFSVESIQGDTIHMNGNHPLAGQTLYFEVEILSIRAATKEELTHGHVHGPGGHHH